MVRSIYRCILVLESLLATMWLNLFYGMHEVHVDLFIAYYIHTTLHLHVPVIYNIGLALMGRALELISQPSLIALKNIHKGFE